MASQYDKHGRLISIDASAPMAKVESGLRGGAGFTDNLTWANTFKNSQTGETRSPQAAAALRNTDPRMFNPAQQTQVASLTGNSPATGGITANIMSQILQGAAGAAAAVPQQFNFGAAFRQPVQSIAQMAAKPTHADDWLLKNRVAGMQRVKPYVDWNKPWQTTDVTRTSPFSFAGR